MNFQLFKLVLEKAEEPEIKLPTSAGSSKKQENSRKKKKNTNIYFCFIDYDKAFDCVDHNKMWSGKFWKRWEYQTTWPASWEICMQVRKQQLELDIEQQTGSKLEKEYVKAVYCHPAYVTSMQSTSWETLGWKKHKLESRLPGEISITSDMQMTPPFGRKWRETKKPLDEGERGEWKSWLKTQHSENEDHRMLKRLSVWQLFKKGGGGLEEFLFILGQINLNNQHVCVDQINIPNSFLSATAWAASPP